MNIDNIIINNATTKNIIQHILYIFNEYDRINKLPHCHQCAKHDNCEYEPKDDEPERINCPFFTKETIKDCTNCKHGGFNDHYNTYFCYYDGDCDNWEKWELKLT